MIVVATLLVAGFSVTIAASAPETGDAAVDAAQVEQVAITPIQRLSLSLGKGQINRGDQDDSTETVAHVVDKVGQVPGFCRLHS